MTKEQRARARLRKWRNDPAAFVREVFNAEPDLWQQEALASVRDNDRTGMSACKGPGKTATLAWIAWWWMFTRPMAQILAFSITRDNLKDNLWKELSSWYRQMPKLMQAEFEVFAERITHKDHPRDWYISARAFPKQADESEQANTLAGFHARHPMIIMDEMGDYPHGVVAAADGIFADRTAEARIVAAWNPTDPAGPAGRACTKDRHKWNIIHITGDPDDPKRSPRIDIEWARREIKENGRDHPWVMINILGLFPPSGAWQVVRTNDAMAAAERSIEENHYLYAPRILGVDPARGGADRTVIFPRQGYQAFEPVIMRTDDTMAVAGRVVQAINDWQPHAVFIDVIGIGAGVVDRLKELGYDEVQAADFRLKSNKTSYFNMRMECWGEMGEWMKQGAIPDTEGLIAELTEPTFDYKSDGRKILCPKDDLNHSPDLADALALTFYLAVPTPAAHDFIDPVVLSKMPRDQRAQIERFAETRKKGDSIADHNPFD